MQKILFSSNNKHKLDEVRSYFSDLPLQIVTPAEEGIYSKIEETGDTFEENAILKSEGLYRLSGLPTFSDDSGFCIKQLGGNPGVYSARYGHEDFSDKERAEFLLKETANFTDRTAWFECVVAFSFGKQPVVFRGKCEGELSLDYDETGSRFGYDPVFYFPPLQKRFSEISKEAKNLISHRGQALKQFREYLEANYF